MKTDKLRHAIIIASRNNRHNRRDPHRHDGTRLRLATHRRRPAKFTTHIFPSSFQLLNESSNIKHTAYSPRFVKANAGSNVQIAHIPDKPIFFHTGTSAPKQCFSFLFPQQANRKGIRTFVSCVSSRWCLPAAKRFDGSQNACLMISLLRTDHVPCPRSYLAPLLVH